MKHLATILAVIAVLIPAFYLTAEDATSTTLPEEMRALNVTMKEIAKLLEKHVAGQETELLIKRVELTNQALISKRDELAKAKEEVRDLTEQEGPLRLNLDHWRESIDRGEVPEDDRETLLVQFEQMEAHLKSIGSRRRDLERGIIELENAVATHEEDMEILEGVLDEKLGLR